MKTFLSLLLALVVFVLGAWLVWEFSAWIYLQNARLIERGLGLPALHLGGRMLQSLLLLAEICLLILLVSAALIRYRKPRVFISFKHIHEEKATEIAHQTERAGMEVLRLPFGNYGHDEIVEFVRRALRKADAVVVIPDAESASFVDAEVMAASVRRIPIALIQYQERQFQPRTLLRGYPVFDYACLEAGGFESLNRYLWFSAGHPREYVRMAGRIFAVFLEPVNWIVFSIMLVAMALMEGLKWLINKASTALLQTEVFQPDMESAIFYNTVFVMLLLGYALYLLYQQWNVLRTARQMASTGTESYQVFCRCVFHPEKRPQNIGLHPGESVHSEGERVGRRCS
jgi:hypothetical protein